jgi:hypothetical protein
VSRNKDIDAVSSALREVHRALLDIARMDYERGHGRLTAAQLFHAVKDDPHFAWLKPLSGLMAAIDELTSFQGGTSDAEASGVRWEVEGIVDGAEHRASFGDRYRELLQSHVDLVLVHAALRRALARLPAPPRDRTQVEGRTAWARRRRPRGKWASRGLPQA